MATSRRTWLAIAALWGGFFDRGYAVESDPFAYFQEEAVVVAATKHVQKQSDAPASTFVITARDIENYGYLTLADALQSVPGIFVTNDRNYSYVWFRGFGRPGDYNGRMLFLINGHRLNENIYGGAYVANDFPIPMEAIERIEIIKGPSSSLYGDSAFFGVVNVISKSASVAPTLHLYTHGGSHQSQKQFLGYSYAPREATHFYFAGSHHRTQGSDYSDSYLRTQQLGTVHGADAEKDYALYSALHHNHWMFHVSANSRSKVVPTGAYESRLHDDRNQTLDERRFAELRWDGPGFQDLDISLRGYYDWYRYKANFYYDQDIAGLPSVRHNLDSAQARWWGDELRLRYKPFGEHNALTLGQEFESNIEGLQANADEVPSTVYLKSNPTPSRWALYSQQEIQIRHNISATFGLRFDRYQTFGSIWNPRAAVVGDLWDGGTAKALYGSAFRAPVPYEMFYETPGLWKTNTRLRPERISTSEIIFEQKTPQGAKATIGFYYSRVTRLISQVTDPQDDLVQFVNRESIRSKGLELGVLVPIMDPRTTLRAGWILQQTHEVNGDRLSNSPTQAATFGLQTSATPWKTTFSATGQVIGRRRSVQGSTLPVVALLNFQFRQPWSRTGLTIIGKVDNLTDTQSVASGAGEHRQDAITQEGRHYYLGLDWRLP